MNETFKQRLILLAFGAMGSVAPDIILFYSKRVTMPDTYFSVAQYSIATALYMALAGVVATIFPYRGRATSWKAFVVGVSLPLIVSAVVSTQRPAMVSPRGFPVPGELIDLLSMF
jgi:peptidoglycan/LPS O-acetylase OafA/YrhL